MLTGGNDEAFNLGFTQSAGGFKAVETLDQNKAFFVVTTNLNGALFTLFKKAFCPFGDLAFVEVVFQLCRHVYAGDRYLVCLHLVTTAVKLMPVIGFSGCSKNQMIAKRRLYDTTQATDFKSKGSLVKFRHHHTAAEGSKIAATLSRRTI